MQLFQYATLTLYQQQNPDDEGPTEEDGENKQNMNCMEKHKSVTLTFVKA